MLYKYEPDKITKAENHLRHALEKSGVKVEPQKTITCTNGRSYNVDLFLDDFLVVEVDGSVHDTPDQQYEDKKRDKDLTESGYPVLRIRNWNVWNNLKNVEKTIKQALKEKP